MLCLPEGTGSVVWTPHPADSPVGKGSAAQFLQYGVREGGDGDEVMIVPLAFIANRNQRFILHFSDRED